MSNQEMRDVMNPRLTEAEIAILESHATRRRLHDGESLFQAGEQRGGFYIVLEGGIEVIDRSGDEPRTIGAHGRRSPE